MARDPRKHQQKLARRKAKDKAKAKRNTGLQTAISGVVARIRRAATAPILHCCTTEALWDQGIAQVLVSRKLPSGQVAFASFLLDAYCLGVKDAFSNVMPRSQYDRQLYGKMSRNFDLVDLTPEAARKLVEGAVAYAAGHGLPPHSDYHPARAIFGDIDAAACSDEFEYGKDGKPFFVSGPHDSPAKCRRIISTLTEHLGPDGFHCMLPMQSSAPLDAEKSIIRIDEHGNLRQITY